jgi:RNA polymerase sigma-B factor
LVRARWAPGERRALEQEVVRLNLPVAREIAMRYRGRGIAMDDLVQVASLGLVKAVRGFDPERGSDFLSYAVPTIRGELRRCFRDAGWTVRPPRSIQELQTEIWRAESDLAQSLQRSPLPREIAAHLRVSEERVLEALGADGCFAPTSLDAPLGDGDDSGVGQYLGEMDAQFDRAEARVILAAVVGRLSERDRTIIRLRFFEGWTQAQIGAAVGVTQMQVSRLLARILGDLRQAVEGTAPPAEAPAA